MKQSSATVGNARLPSPAWKHCLLATTGALHHCWNRRARIGFQQLLFNPALELPGKLNHRARIGMHYRRHDSSR
eukprot:scaffold3797_cov91-Skeletonema_dohrnii-CCMP3373.AAC.18